MYEKYYEYNIELYNALIDFNQAFDSISRSTVAKVLKEMQRPEKIVSLVNLVTQHTKAKIKLNSEYTEQIEVKTGIKQGDPLSTIPFCTVMESLMKKLETRRNISTRLKQVCAYADDVVLVTRTKQVQINTLQKLKQEAEKYGLVINQNKTKYVRHSRTQTYLKDMEIETEGMKIEEVNIVKYHGTTVTKDNKIEEEIKERIAAGNRAFFMNKKIFQSKLASKKSKIKLYKTIIRPILVNGYKC
jgi:ethanolamine utilization protein EutQ (cupin superfamily)